MSFEPDELRELRYAWATATELVREAARVAHDKLFATAASDNEACVDCFQHQASEEPCQSCAVIAEAILAERERCASFVDSWAHKAGRTTFQGNVYAELARRLRSGKP